MKKLSLAVLFLGVAGFFVVQSMSSVTKPETKPETNLKSPAKLKEVTQPNDEYKATMEGWEVRLEKAYEISKRTGKPIMANFTGSDWCGWCIRLKKDVFVKDEFKKWADQNVVLLELDFPRRLELPEDIKMQNSMLQQQFQVRGYPTIWIFEVNQKDGKFNLNALGSTSYQRSVDAFTSSADKILTNSTLKPSKG